MSRSIDQHTAIDKRIHDFVERKSSPWYEFSKSVMDKLGRSVSVTTRNASREGIGYEAINWKKVTSR